MTIILPADKRITREIYKPLLERGKIRLNEDEFFILNLDKCSLISVDGISIYPTTVILKRFEKYFVVGQTILDSLTFEDLILQEYIFKFTF